ncbi:MAG: hypothetical protein ACERKZ_05365 [Lachnotalea sp.]
MICSKNASFIVRGANLEYCRENHINIKLAPNKFQIIKGIVYNQRLEPCEGAVVQVIQINGKTKSKIILGYVTTNEEGEYLFSIEANPSMKYELTIFAPLI